MLEEESLMTDSGGKMEPVLFERSASDSDNLIQADQQTETAENLVEDHNTNNIQSLMHLLKGNIGTGILAMPIAVMHAGLWVGFGGILILGAIATHCMHLLVKCSRVLCIRCSVQRMGYADIMENSLKTGPQKLRKLHHIARPVINIFLIFTQFGFCCVYIVFIADNVEQVITGFHAKQINSKIYMLMITLMLVFYVFIKNFRTLALFSALANVITTVGLIIIFMYIFQDLPDVSSRPAFNSFKTLPLYFGTAMYAFEGISLVLPIENKMRTPEDFGGWTGVLNLGMVIVVVLYTSIGFYGYLRLGDNVKGSITLNLPNDHWIYLIVKLLFAVSIFLSYGLQFYVPIDIIWPSIKTRITSPQIQYWGEYLCRIFFVVLTFSFAVAIPHLDLLISLIGACASSGLALIFPSIIELITYSVEEDRLSTVTVVKNIVILLIGVIGLITGTYSSVVAIIDKF